MSATLTPASLDERAADLSRRCRDAAGVLSERAWQDHGHADMADGVRAYWSTRAYAVTRYAKLVRAGELDHDRADALLAGIERELAKAVA